RTVERNLNGPTHGHPPAKPSSRSPQERLPMSTRSVRVQGASAVRGKVSARPSERSRDRVSVFDPHLHRTVCVLRRLCNGIGGENPAERYRPERTNKNEWRCSIGDDVATVGPSEAQSRLQEWGRPSGCDGRSSMWISTPKSNDHSTHKHSSIRLQVVVYCR